MRTCKRCKQQKQNEDYSFNRCSKDKLHTNCKICANEIRIEWRKNNPKRYKQQQKKAYEIRKLKELENKTKVEEQ